MDLCISCKLPIRVRQYTLHTFFLHVFDLTYTKCKLHMECESYLPLNINKYERSMLGKLRSGTLPLYIEKGRHEVNIWKVGLFPFVRYMRLKMKYILLLSAIVILQKELIFLLYL